MSDIFWDKLGSGLRPVAVELDPPAEGDGAPFLEDARILRDAGADAVTIADSPMGRARADSCLLACKLRRELGVEVLPHMTCRDRNWTAVKALLLGLAIEDLHSVLLVAGDPVPPQDREEVRGVFHFGTPELVRRVSELGREGTFFRIFCALNVNARDFDGQLRHAREKEEAGACGFLTQPVLSQTALDNLKRARETLRGKLLGGIYPVVSHKNACFLDSQVPGISVCEEIRALYEGKDRAEGESLAEEVSVRIAQETAPWTDGTYLMTPFRRVALVSRILRRL